MSRELTVGSLFAGIGGFDLGLERAGMRTVWLCERDRFCRRVLAEHWPGVPCYPDVRLLVAQSRPAEASLSMPVPQIDVRRVSRVAVLCGGFPCQPVSDAGAKRAQDDERWLWPEFARLIAELRPGYVLVENVRGLYGRGLDIVLGDLAALRYDAEWGRISAADVGAHHGRPRVWIVAYPNADSEGQRTELQLDRASLRPDEARAIGDDADRFRPPVSHAADGLRKAGSGPGPRVFGPGWWRDAGQLAGWEAEPDVGRVADGISARLDNARLNALGNALVPRIAELIGRRIVAYEEGRLAHAA